MNNTFSRIFRTLLFACSIVLLCLSCDSGKKHYLIGISQCSEDSWRSKLKDELEMSTFFNEDVEIMYASADDNAQEQEKQILDMVDDGVDLLIVSPQQIELLSDAINHAYDKGVPVILFDRKTNSDKYTAFMGADNFAIGKMLGEYAAAKLHGQGCIVEIKGEEGSSPAVDRSRGFRSAIEKYSGLKIVGSGNGTWKEESGQKVMGEILKTYSGPIDCVFGGNDRMAVGARSVLKEKGREKGVLFLGIDALPNQGAGICQVRDSILSASAIYPTHGDELMQLALDILDGHSFSRENHMASSIVTPDNARVLLLQHEEIARQSNYLKKMHVHATKTNLIVHNQRLLLIGFLCAFLIVVFLLVLIIRQRNAKARLNEQLSDANATLTEQRNQLEIQRDTLQEQHDKLCEQRDEMELQRDELAVQRDQLQRLHIEVKEIVNEDEIGDSSFYNKFMQILNCNIGNSDFSVEDLADALGMSRAQLFRRCKTMSGHSPVELLRIQRMKQAVQLLSSSEQTVSEVTYLCGFTSPSYFSKCFKEYYGMAPSDFVRHYQDNKKQ